MPGEEPAPILQAVSELSTEAVDIKALDLVRLPEASQLTFEIRLPTLGVLDGLDQRRHRPTVDDGLGQASEFQVHRLEGVLDVLPLLGITDAELLDRLGNGQLDDLALGAANEVKTVPVVLVAGSPERAISVLVDPVAVEPDGRGEIVLDVLSPAVRKVTLR